jgi:hypothetical protein
MKPVCPLFSFLGVGIVLAACGPDGPASSAPVNCKLQGYASPAQGAVVDQCGAGQICAVIDAGDAGTSFPICLKAVSCEAMPCDSNKCAQNLDTVPASTSCLKQ